MEINKIYNESCLDGLKKLPDNCIDTCITSPPYWLLRDYKTEGQLGIEQHPDDYVKNMVDVFREVKRVLKQTGTLWLNLGDTYCGYWGDKKAKEENRPSSADTNGWTNGFNMNSRPKYENIRNSGIKPKDLVGIPWMTAFALRTDGWWLRSDIIWQKMSPMPETVKDRPTKSHEYIFLLTKKDKYYYNQDAIREPLAESTKKREQYTRITKNGKTKDCDDFGVSHTRETNSNPKGRNKRSVWTVASKNNKEAHFATYSLELIDPMILAGCPENGIILDPFMGSGTTAIGAIKNNRNYIGFELNPEYVNIANNRIERFKNNNFKE